MSNDVASWGTLHWFSINLILQKMTGIMIGVQSSFSANDRCDWKGKMKLLRHHFGEHSLLQNSDRCGRSTYEAKRAHWFMK
jgi:hypothetical protein